MVTSYSLIGTDYHVLLNTVHSAIQIQVPRHLGYLEKHMTSQVPGIFKELTTLVFNISGKGQEAVDELMLPVPTLCTKPSTEGMPDCLLGGLQKGQRLRL